MPPIEGPPAHPQAADSPVRRAFAVLQLVVAAPRAVGVRELARRANLSSSSVGRLTQLLSDIGMLERNADGAVSPGPALATLSRRFADSPAALRENYRTMAHAISIRFGENAAIAVDHGDGVLYVTSARVPNPVQVADPLDRTYDYHLVSPGILMMSEWTPQRTEAHLALSLRRATTLSITDPQAIRQRLAHVRSTGYAWTDQELDLDVNGLAAPIRNTDGMLIATATIYGPAYRLAEAVQPHLGRDLASFVAAYAADSTGEGSAEGNVG